MKIIGKMLQQAGKSLQKGGGRRFCLPIIALLCAAALGSWFMMRPSEAEWTADALYYVKPDGSGDGKGSSWTNAMSGTAFSAKLKEINAAKDGKAYEFRVAKGIYEQSETLRLPKGVKLYGGCAGTETTAEEIVARDIAKKRHDAEPQRCYCERCQFLNRHGGHWRNLRGYTLRRLHRDGRQKR